MHDSQGEVAVEAACCPECGASTDFDDFTATVTEASFSCRFVDGELRDAHVGGWSGDCIVTCPDCSWSGDFMNLVPESQASKQEES